MYESAIVRTGLNWKKKKKGGTRTDTVGYRDSAGTQSAKRRLRRARGRDSRGSSAAGDREERDRRDAAYCIYKPRYIYRRAARTGRTSGLTKSR